MSMPNLAIRIDHFVHGGREDEVLAALQRIEAIMSELSDYTRELRTAVDEMKARIDADVAELQRLISLGISTEEQKAEARAILDDLRGIDPVADFPAPPPAEGGEGTVPTP